MTIQPCFSDPVKHRDVVGAFRMLLFICPIPYLRSMTCVNLCIPQPNTTDMHLNELYNIFIALLNTTSIQLKALAGTLTKITLLKAFLRELGVGTTKTPALWCDNLVQPTFWAFG